MFLEMINLLCEILPQNLFSENASYIIHYLYQPKCLTSLFSFPFYKPQLNIVSIVFMSLFVYLYTLFLLKNQHCIGPWLKKKNKNIKRYILGMKHL